MTDGHDHLRDLPDGAELRELAARLDASAARYASERPGLADRVFAASAPALGAAPASIPLPWVRRWGLAAAAAVALVASVTVVLVSQPRADRAAGIVGVAMMDEEAALHAADGGGIDAGAVVLMHGGSADDVTIELEELLAAGTRR
jgi:hypothetical protein